MAIISGIQQIGVGVENVNEAWAWYRKYFGFNIPVVDDNGVAESMLPYTGGIPQRRHAIIAINIQGGGGLEIWQYSERKPEAAKFDVKLGDYGVFATKIKSKNIEALYKKLKSGEQKLLSEIYSDSAKQRCFFTEDPYGNIFQIVENDNIFKNSKELNGGVFGAVIGVSNIENSIDFYKNILGYDKLLYKEEGVFREYKNISGGDEKISRVLLAHSKSRTGAFSRLLGESQIELVQAHERKVNKIYENRFWGDLGFIQICFDVQNMNEIKELCEKNGHGFTVDSNPEIYETGGEIFGMGDAAGHFTYIEDPDGTLIEFVETYKIPILKKFGWYLNLKKRKPGKALPDWMLKTLSFNKVK